MNQPKEIARSLSRRRFITAAAAVATASGVGSALAAVPAAEALALAQGRRRDLLELLDSMIRIRSLSGESAAEAQEVVKGFLSELPYRIEESADRPSRYIDHPEYMPPNPPGDGPFINVVGHPESGTARHALFSHIDTHVLADGWATDPFEPTLRGGRLYGLGTSDDKGGVAAMLMAAAILADIDGPLPVVMSLHGKGGGCRGSLPVFERFRHSGAPIDAVLYVHPAETGRGLEDIKTEVQGVLDLELAVTGWRAPPMEIGSIDSAPWEGGGNALDLCMAALAHLRRTVFDDVQVNVGIMQGGDRIGSVATDASARFRLKFSGEHTWRALLDSGARELQTYMADVARDAVGEQSFQMRLDPVAYRTNPGAADWDAPVSLELRDAIEGVTGRAPDAYPNHYAGDIRYPIRLLGVPAYGIGSLGGGFYGPNEWVDVDDLVKLTAVVVQTLSGWSDLS